MNYCVRLGTLFYSCGSKWPTNFFESGFERFSVSLLDFKFEEIVVLLLVIISFDTVADLKLLVMPALYIWERYSALSAELNNGGHMELIYEN